ncbi:MAG: hypothetical protein HY711_01285, partial [Candidatus Melainabacteria bacterium]|nr:hypothetical protein [Candidatus Melainabacteria bacterium]
MSNIFDLSLRHRQSLACLLFESAIERDCLGHAYLLTGSASEDKWLLAKQLALFLNCTTANKLTLGVCHTQHKHNDACQNCQWIVANQHPAAWMSLTGDDSKTGKIGVAASRLLREELSKTSPFTRVVVIPHSGEDSFHRPAAAALLKTLEEPGPRCLFLLFARYPQEVCPTIVSRCHA